jgi:AhpD family alkylhydroperoxidase
MTLSKLKHICAAGLLASAAVLGCSPGSVAEDAMKALEDIENTYGVVPGFFRLVPASELEGAWAAFRALQLNTELATDAKTRELIAVAVAAQGPCRPCVYFHAAAAYANGASEAEIAEAVAIGAVAQKFDGALAGAGSDIDRFRRETDLLLWNDVQTVEARGPKTDFCNIDVAWVGGELVACD